MTIKELRQMNNMSQREFAALIGVTQAAIMKWEKADVKLGIENQNKIDSIFHFKRGSKRATSMDLGIE